MSGIKIKQKEAKTLTFTIKDSDGAVIDVSSATLTFIVKSGMEGTLIFTKDDADFDKTDAANGVVSVVLTTTDTDRTGTYIGELKTHFSDTNIDKSSNIEIIMQKAITDQTQSNQSIDVNYKKEESKRLL